MKHNVFVPFCEHTHWKNKILTFVPLVVKKLSALEKNVKLISSSGNFLVLCPNKILLKDRCLRFHAQIWNTSFLFGFDFLTVLEQRVLENI